MKKEVVVAICIGFLIGSSVALAILYFPSIFKKNTATPTSVAQITPSVTPPQAAATGSGLVIESPAENAISAVDTIQVSGKAPSDSLVVFDTDSDTAVSQLDENGSFQEKIELTEGGNIISVTQYAKNGETEETKTLTVFYIPEET